MIYLKHCHGKEQQSYIHILQPFAGPAASPLSLQELIPAEHPVRIVSQIIGSVNLQSPATIL